MMRSFYINSHQKSDFYPQIQTQKSQIYCLHVWMNTFCKKKLQISQNFLVLIKQNMLNKVSLLFVFIAYKSLNGYTCSSNTNCVVDCSSTSCTYATIDGTNALSLTVKCPKSTSTSYSKCKYTNIKCPSKYNSTLLECNVNCDEYGCYYTTITYNEYTSLNLECKNDYSCYDAKLKSASSLDNLKALANIANITCLVSKNTYSYR